MSVMVPLLLFRLLGCCRYPARMPGLPQIPVTAKAPERAGRL